MSHESAVPCHEEYALRNQYADRTPPSPHLLEVAKYSQKLKSRPSSLLCCIFLLFASAVAFSQVLLRTGSGIDTYSPVDCWASNLRIGAHEADRTLYLWEGGRLRFPRTKRHLPQCIIIGARKCGTRALIEFLNLHPLIQKATQEVHFFDDDTNYARGLDWYRRRMPYSFPGQITVEKSPAYFVTPSAPARIRTMDASARLLLIVRDPVTRLLSDYAQLADNKARRDRHLASFEHLVLRPSGQVNTGYKAVRIGMYAIYFPMWLRSFPRSQIHIVDGDRFVVDPFDEIQKIENFLGIGHRIMKKNFYYNDTKGFFCIRNDTAGKCLNDSKGRKHPEVSSEILRVLRQFYHPHNREFFRQASINFSWPIL